MRVRAVIIKPPEGARSALNYICQLNTEYMDIFTTKPRNWNLLQFPHLLPLLKYMYSEVEMRNLGIEFLFSNCSLVSGCTVL